MPYKVGKKTKTKGWPILKFERGIWGRIKSNNYFLTIFGLS